MTSGSILPKRRCSSEVRNSTMINVSTAENTAEIISSCPEEREASFSFLLPIYWLMITALPDANAVKQENQNRVE